MPRRETPSEHYARMQERFDPERRFWGRLAGQIALLLIGGIVFGIWALIGWLCR